MKNVGGQVCQICSDNVGKTVDGDPFVACNVCAFPVCRPCYEYERKDGNQSCPQCKTRYKRQKGLLNKIMPVNIFQLLHIRKRRDYDSELLATFSLLVIYNIHLDSIFSFGIYACLLKLLVVNGK